MTTFLLCMKIFFIRIIDVSLGTFRTIISIKSKPFFASVIGFIEILVWFLIAREALNSANNNIWIAISYSLGFATGTYIGLLLSNYFINENLTVQIISNNYNLSNIIKKNGYGVSVIEINKFDSEKKYMFLIEIKNKSLNHLSDIIHSYDKNSFIIVTETKYSVNGFIK